MNKKNLLMGLALSGMLTAANCQASGTVQEAPSDSGTATGQCHGVNTCKGTGACGGADSSCHGSNACKGKGWLKLSSAECAEKGGTFKKQGK